MDARSHASRAMIALVATLALAACNSTEPATECASKTRWNGANSGSAFMNPGLACIDCHTRMQGAPQLGAAGTVFQTTSEPDLCNGVGSVTVEIIDADGTVTSIPTNAAGNFYTTHTQRFPIRARVISANGVHEMVDAVPSGDCNSCHTTTGTNNAPGRIVPL